MPSSWVLKIPQKGKRQWVFWKCALRVPVVTGYLPTLWVNILEGTYGERQDVERRPSLLPAFTKALSLRDPVLLLARQRIPADCGRYPCWILDCCHA